MTTLDFNSNIKASAAKVWQVLWNDSTYRKWTSAFHEGSYAVSDWKEGSKIQFLSPDGGGMYSMIAENKPNEYMAFKHLGVVKNFEEQPMDDETKSWSGSMETYRITEDDGVSTLKVQVDTLENFSDYFTKTFPNALLLVKELAESPIDITVETLVAAPIEKIWKLWTLPEHITKWNNASDDWHTPHAENDLRVGGKFLSRMAAKDGSFSFDFIGTYTVVELHKKIEYTLADGRNVKINFSGEGSKIKVVETFEAETANTLELQQSGWQNIIDNFKKYTESN